MHQTLSRNYRDKMTVCNGLEKKAVSDVANGVACSPYVVRLPIPMRLATETVGDYENGYRVIVGY